MSTLPPGTILQMMYLKARLQKLRPARFIEVGPGGGEVTRLLLDHGWSGWSFDLDSITIESLRTRFAREILEKRYVPVHDDFLLTALQERVELVVSCMVMEHLTPDAQVEFMNKSANCLREGGVMVGLVPASPADWGIEDEIAGHCRRYTRRDIEALAVETGWKSPHVAGLTFPLSNLLLPISNFLVERSKRSKLALSRLERTKQSGRRRVTLKTHFPACLGFVLNEFALLPFHWIQRFFTKSNRALVLYFELRPEVAKWT